MQPTNLYTLPLSRPVDPYELTAALVNIALVDPAVILATEDPQRAALPTPGTRVVGFLYPGSGEYPQLLDLIWLSAAQAYDGAGERAWAEALCTELECYALVAADDAPDDPFQYLEIAPDGSTSRVALDPQAVDNGEILIATRF
ncbi:MAG: hypothetical protein HC915_00565 [Anaerolineae bacterium]|nr:hypothetical protein [Anaerolineae bacterium]